ncbi:MAG: HDIG domain-containing protein [Acidobacteria bacterium]|nr:HDIG domain-containing protein [Acidobacteriota bacterium]MBI3655321.1 HDIG domain-containing protein [Acidobacteriota bacterium]
MPHRQESKATPSTFHSAALVADRLLETIKSRLIARLTWYDFGWGLAIAAVFSVLLVSYKYQSIPIMRIGERSPIEVRAATEAIIEDLTATLGKRSEVVREIPAIFNYDATVLYSMQNLIQKLFAAGRAALTEYDAADQVAGKPRELQVEAAESSTRMEMEVSAKLKEEFGDSVSDDVLAIGFHHRFAAVLEGQMIDLLKTVMDQGVINNKESLLQPLREKNEIRIVNVTTGDDEKLDPNMRDVLQARQSLRKNQSKLAVADKSELPGLIRFLESLITPNVFFNQTETNKRRNEAADQVSNVVRYVPQGKVIVHAGELVTKDAMVELEALRRFQKPEELAGRFLGGWLICLVFMYIVWHYFAYHQKRHGKIRNHYLLIMLVLFLNLVTSRLATFVADLLHGRIADLVRSGRADFLHERLGLGVMLDSTVIYYTIPLAFGAILIALLVDVQFAILYTLFFAVLMGMATSSIPLVCYVLVGSFAAIYGIKQYKERSTIVKAGFAIGMVNIVTLLALDLFSGVYPSLPALGGNGLCGLISGITAAMIASLALPALESAFKITTDIKLLELSNLNTPILRQMAVAAPGTYHHSIAVGTLAEAAAEAIGANPLLVRVASYYHDIGKLKMAEYYVENQILSQNKHDKLTPHMSALIIANHVNAGLAMAKEIRLMPRISDMIPEHHGTRLMTYFYEKAKAAARKEDEVRPSDFRYPGPKPQSREAAIMMISDSVEAASRTLIDPTPTQIQGMIRRIIDAVVADGQLSECDITLKDLNSIELSMLRVISGAYHHRIEYPGYDFSKLKAESTAAKQSSQ